MKNYILISQKLWFQEGPGVRKNQYTVDGVKLLNVANLVDGKVDLSTSDCYVSKETAYGKYKHFLVDEGDFVIASSGIKVDYFDKKMGIIEKRHLPLCMNTSTIRFKVLNERELSIKYFMYYLKSNHFKEQLNREITGSAQLNFGPSHLKKMVFPYVPRAVQEKIVDILDQINKIEDALKSKVDLLDQLVKSRFIELFGNPVENNLGWKKSSLSKLTFKIGSGATPRGGRAAYIRNGISLVRSMNVYDGLFVYDNLAFISDEQARKLDNVVVEKDDIFLNITGASVARSCIVPINVLPARVNQHVAILRCNQSLINCIFLNNLLLNVQFKNKLLAIGESNGATREAITKKQLEDLEIILPPISLQLQFSEFVNQVDKSKLAIQKSLDELEILKKSLMQKYFG